MKVASITTTGKNGSVTVPDSLFGVTVNKALLAQAIRVYRANKRQGTSKVLGRSEVSLTKSKVYKQKGTGNARHGAKSAPIFVGGGVAHGPTGLENWSLQLSKKMKIGALISALSAQAEQFVIADGINDFSGKTKEAVKYLAPVITTARKVLVLLEDRNPKAERALANIPNVLIMTTQLVNAYDIAAANTVVTTSKAIKALETRLIREENPVAVAAASVEEKKPAKAPAAPKKTKTVKKSE